jgi:hypothetical protein
LLRKVNKVSQDIDNALSDWEYQHGLVQARLVQARDREVIQMRVDLGILQMETGPRPDGTKPHGFATYFAYLQDQARAARRTEKEFILSQEQCLEADREFLQFYQRRICWLALGNFPRAIADADHTLAFMDFVRAHSPSEEYTQAHEQYRGFVLFQRTQAAAALEVENKKPEAAIDEIRAGLERLRTFFASFEAEEQMDNDGMVQHLRKIEKSLRGEYKIEATLQEQLDKAVANEEYERAAKLRDALRKRQ